jgi:sulfonate transport system permease protein
MICRCSKTPKGDSRGTGRSGNGRPCEITRILGWTLMPALVLLVWEIAARGAGNYLFPPATQVFRHLLHPWADVSTAGSLAGNTLISLVRVLLGFLVAGAVGVALGLLLGSVRTLRNLFEPFVEILRPLCPIAWIPFAIAVFGLTTLPQAFGVRYTHTTLDHVQLGMLFVLFWGGFFPVLINTIDGVAGVRRNYVALARTLGAGRAQLFLRIHLPAALPSVLTGLRQGIGTCWFVLIAAEMLPGCESGIGYLLLEASDLSEMDIVILSMCIIGCIGAGLNFSLRWALQPLVRWHGRET